MAKRPRPDFTNGSGDNSNSGCILGPWHKKKHFCSPELVVSENFIHLMTAITGPRLDFNNCQWDDLNNGRILAHRPLLESYSNNGLSPGLCNLGQMKDTPVQVSHLWSPGWGQVCRA